MLSSEWIDIALGVVVVWFLLALAVSAVNEAVIRLLAMRSKQLWLALNQLLDTPGHQRDPKWLTLRTASATAFSLWKYQGRPEDPTDTTHPDEPALRDLRHPGSGEHGEAGPQDPDPQHPLLGVRHRPARVGAAEHDRAHPPGSLRRLAARW